MSLRLLSLLAVTILLAACAQTQVPIPRTAAHYLQEGDEFFADKRFEDAIASWEKVRESYSSPETVAQAELKIAEAHYLAEHYVEAAVAYDAFLKAHPDHPRTADVLYYLGLSYLREILTPDRDQTTTRNALAAFETFRKRFPADPRADEIEPFIEQCRNQLAGNELHIGSYYLVVEQCRAAIGRLKPLLDDYPAFSRRDEALYQLGKAYLACEDRPAAATVFNELYRDFPRSKFILKAQKLIGERF